VDFSLDEKLGGLSKLGSFILLLTCSVSVSLIYVLCSPVDMNDEIASQGLTQVRSSI
jgi:hypothetical protein